MKNFEQVEAHNMLSYLQNIKIEAAKQIGCAIDDVSIKARLDSEGSLYMRISVQDTKNTPNENNKITTTQLGSSRAT